MSNKKLRNKPCPCESGRKFKDCCLGLNPQEIEKKRQTRERLASDFMRKYEEETEKKNQESSQKLDESVLNQLKTQSLKDILFSLGALSLLPENQSKEMRFAMIAQAALAKQPIEPQPTSTGKVGDISALCAKFDEVFGSQFTMYEVDNLDIIYISWVKLGDEYFRTFSGTLSDSEVFINENLEKAFVLAPYLSEPLASSSETTRDILSHIDSFIESADLLPHESDLPSDYEQETIAIPESAQDLMARLSTSFTFKKTTLQPRLRDLFKRLSKQPGSYNSDFPMWEADIYTHPVIDFGDEYVIPFPQVLVTAIIRAIYEEAKGSDNTATIREKFREYSSERVYDVLVQMFGHKSVIGPLTLDGEEWVDFAVNFDGKVILVTVPTALRGDNMSKLVDSLGKRMINGYSALEKTPSKTVRTNDRVYRFEEIIQHFEPIFLVIPDQADYDLTIGSNLSAGEHLLRLMPYSHLRYIGERVDNPLRFIRFLRAIERLRATGTRLVETNTLDLWAIYAGNESLQIRDSETMPNMIMFDVTAGSRKVSEDIKKFREERILAEVEDKKVILRKHWDHFFGVPTGDPVRLYRFDSKPKIEIEAFPARGTEQQRSSSYLVFDSLCYFLSQHLSDVSELFKDELEAIKLHFKLGEDTHDIQASIKQSEDGKIAEIYIVMGPDAYKLFGDGTNNGERTVIRTFLNLFDGDRASGILDSVMPQSEDRRFQVKSFRLAHPSYEHAVEPTLLSIGDESWVDEVVSKAILQAGIKPGDYSGRDVASHCESIKQAALEELRRRVTAYPKQELIERSYGELEAVYVADERSKFKLIASLETDQYGDPLNEQIKNEQDYGMLSFANRLLLELTLQSGKEGDAILTREAYLELLSLAARVVEIDFWGDATYLGLQPGTLNISKGGYPSVSTNSDKALELARLRLQSSVRSQEKRSSILEEESETEEKAGGIEEIYKRLNPAAKETWGFELEERNAVEQELLHLFDDSESPLIMIHQNTLVDRIVSNTKLDKEQVEKILDELKLSQEILEGKDISPSVRYWRDERLLNKPIVVVPANPKLLVFSRFVVERSVLLFYDRLVNGRLEYIKKHPDAAISKAVMELVNESATKFENEVIGELRGMGLNADGQLHSLGGEAIPGEGVGEIDGLAWSDEQNKLFVIESKNNTASRSPVEIKTEIDNYFGTDRKPGYYAQLQRKFDWVSANPDLVRKHFKIDPATNYEIEGILVTRSLAVASVLKDAPFRTITLRDLPTQLLETPVPTEEEQTSDNETL